ncbi:hypothetical protein ATN89_17535 [Comamonas thiooxydans]|uniref:thioredoxin family protein n=1 Tax=Comamonas thiooxydans TaxID=363952 RepID=UPI0007C53F0B|nr:thioredoxin family protein [Comamonas thiooxydans]OAD82884.1 hypothetical protein ATN89_17535 [Comamonas thiooxydans]
MTYRELVLSGFDGVVCFTAANCAPCKRLKPILEKVCEENLVPMVTVDIQENLADARALGLRGSPSVVSLRANGSGESTAKLVHTGDATEAQILSKLVAANAI